MGFVVSPRGTAPFALAVSLALALLAGCGGGGKKATLGPSSSEVAPSTSTTIDPGLKNLLLVAADVPTFKEDTSPDDPAAVDDDPLKRCDAALPAFKAMDDVPSADGATFVRDVGNAVSATSSASSADSQKAEAALTELLSPEATACFNTAIAGAIEAGNPNGGKATAKTTVTKSSVPGIDQVVLLSSTATVNAAGKAIGVRFDFVFLRSQGTVVVVFYGGPTALTSVAERQKIVGAVSKKLAAASGSADTSVSSTSSTSSTSATGAGSSTTRRSTTTTRRSGSTTSSTTKASTTSSTAR